jgi:hypothetical protein
MTPLGGAILGPLFLTRATTSNGPTTPQPVPDFCGDWRPASAVCARGMRAVCLRYPRQPYPLSQLAVSCALQRVGKLRHAGRAEELSAALSNSATPARSSSPRLQLRPFETARAAPRPRRRRVRRRPSIAATVAVMTTRVSRVTRIRTSGRFMVRRRQAACDASNSSVRLGFPYRPRSRSGAPRGPCQIFFTGKPAAIGCVVLSSARVQVARPQA